MAEYRKRQRRRGHAYFSKGIGRFTKETRQHILDALRAGNYRKTAAEAAGIHHLTLHKWIKQGEIDSYGEFHDFYQAVLQAEAESEQAALRMWTDQMPKDWKAAATFLGRRFRERWGPPQSDQAPADVKVVITGGSKHQSASTPHSPDEGGAE